MQPIRVWKKLAAFLIVIGSCFGVHYIASEVNPSQKEELCKETSWQDPYIGKSTPPPPPPPPPPPAQSKPVQVKRVVSPPQNMAQQHQMLEREQRKIDKINEKLHLIEKQLEEEGNL